MSPATTRSVPPVAVDGARTPVTAASGEPFCTGTPTVPLAPPQLTARTTTSASTARPAAMRPRGHARMRSGSGRPCRPEMPSHHPFSGPPGSPSADVGGDLADLRELVGVQAGTADECTVDVRPGQDP